MRTSETVRIGLVLPMFSSDAGRVLGFARRAEDLGFDGVFSYDHLMPLGGPDDGPSLEPFTTLAAVAAVTTRIRIGTLVARASLRPVGLLAKLAAQLDGMSDGRAILAVGTGDELSKREHDAFGLPYLDIEERRRHLVEVLGALRALFAGEPWPGGASVGPLAGPLLPPPARPGGPTLWVGGRSEGVVRIAATIGDGWNGWGLSEEGFARRARSLAEQAGRLGRLVEPTWGGVALVGRDAAETDELVAARRRRGLDLEDLWIGDAPQLVARLRSLERHGATWVVLLPAGPRDRLEVIAELVLPALREGR